MKYLLITLLLICGNLFAQTGVFMDPERTGEGITVFEHERLDKTTAVTFYFYTYNVIGDDQRWLFGSDEFDPKMQQTEGYLYQTHSLNYPEGVPSTEPFEPLGVRVGKVFTVGYYTLRKTELGGWKMWVVPADDDVGTDDAFEPTVSPPKPDPDFDYLYNRTWWFTYPVILIRQ